MFTVKGRVQRSNSVSSSYSGEVMTGNVVPLVKVYFDDPDHLFTHEDRILLTQDIRAAVDLDTDALQVHHGARIGLTVHADPSIPEAASALYQPSALDNGILADLGYHLKPADHILAGFV
jgi:hypothetical protein